MPHSRLVRRYVIVPPAREGGAGAGKVSTAAAAAAGRGVPGRDGYQR